MALSSAETEYIASHACAQILWISQHLSDLGLDYKEFPIKCDNTSAISVTMNPIQQSHTKHIDMIDIRDHYNKKNQIANIFIKLLSEYRFNYLVCKLSMLYKGAQT